MAEFCLVFFQKAVKEGVLLKECRILFTTSTSSINKSEGRDENRVSRRVLYPTWQLLNLILGGYQAKLATTAKNVISNKERENVHSTTPPIYRFLQLHYNIAMLECLI